MLKRIVILSIVGVFLCLTITAQNPTIRIYSAESGFEQNGAGRLILDKNKNLWVSSNSGLAVFNGKNFLTVQSDIFLYRLGYLTKDDSDNLLVGSSGKVFSASAQNLKLKLLDTLAPKNIIFNKEIKSDNQNNKHLRNFEYAYYHYVLLKKNWQQLKVEITSCIEKNNLLKDIPVIFLIDSCVILSQNADHFCFQYHTCELLPIQHALPTDLIAKGFIFHTSNGTFCLYNHGIYSLVLLNNTLKAKLILDHVLLDKNTDNLVDGEFDNSSGQFYFGSPKLGLIVVSPPSMTSMRHESNIKSAVATMLNSAYYSQVELNSGQILVGNYLTIDQKGNSKLVANLSPQHRAVNFRDQQQRVWYQNGRTLITIDSNNCLTTLPIPELRGALVSMCQIDENNFQAISNSELIQIQNNGLKKYCRKSDLGIPESEDLNFIYKAPDHHGKIYILTSKNIYIFDHGSGRAQLIPNLTLADYRMMTQLKKDLYFVGTYGQGYYLFDGSKWHKMPLDAKGYLKFAHTALLDHQNHIWISSNNGLFRTRSKDLFSYTKDHNHEIFYYYYEKSAGFATNEFNGGCQSPAIKLRDGRFSFSSIDGLVQFDPAKVPALFPENPLNIIQLWLNDKAMDSLPQHLFVSQDVKEIKLEVNTAFYGHANNLVIQYKIRGYVDKWTNLEGMRYITLQNARHGSFEIQIRKRRGFDPGAFDYLNYPVTVRPYFYQTWWFISLLFLLGFLSTYLFSRWYSRYIIKKNEELEVLIARKNAGLVQTNQALTEKIKQNDLFQSILAHDIKAPLRFIASSSDIILNYWPTVTDEIKKENIWHIYESAFKMGSFIDETLLWIQIRNGEVEAQKSTFAIHDLFVDSIKLVQKDPKILEGQVQIRISCDATLQITSDPILIATVMRNLVSNSINYSASGTVTLFAEKGRNGNVVFGCGDEGKGMDPELISVLLSEEYRGNSIRKDSFRMGYVIIKEIVRLIGANLSIQSSPRLGSMVLLSLPLADSDTDHQN